jgi:hypothetical protein
VRARHGCGQAAQSGQVGDGGIISLLPLQNFKK